MSCWGQDLGYSLCALPLRVHLSRSCVYAHVLMHIFHGRSVRFVWKPCRAERPVICRQDDRLHWMYQGGMVARNAADERNEAAQQQELPPPPAGGPGQVRCSFVRASGGIPSVAG